MPLPSCRAKAQSLLVSENHFFQKNIGWILIRIRTKNEEMGVSLQNLVVSSVLILDEQVAFLEWIFSEIF